MRYAWVLVLAICSATQRERESEYLEELAPHVDTLRALHEADVGTLAYAERLSRISDLGTTFFLCQRYSDLIVWLHRVEEWQQPARACDLVQRHDALMSHAYVKQADTYMKAYVAHLRTLIATVANGDSILDGQVGQVALARTGSPSEIVRAVVESMYEAVGERIPEDRYDVFSSLAPLAIVALESSMSKVVFEHSPHDGAVVEACSESFHSGGNVRDVRVASDDQTMLSTSSGQAIVAEALVHRPDERFCLIYRVEVNRERGSGSVSCSWGDRRVRVTRCPKAS